MVELKDPATEILFILLVTMSVIRLGYYWISYRRLAFFKKKSGTNDRPPVSVIICEKNEVENLKKFLNTVMDQSYPEYEVIVINDCSWDESGDYLGEMAKQYKHLKIVTIQEQEKYRHGKKFALTLGIKAASHELLVMTDADCKPAGKDWLTGIVSNFTDDTEIVLGYGPYQKAKGFLNRLIRFDTFMIAVTYLSSALGGNAYMGVGRNMAYRRSLFFRSKGFAKHNHIFSGDDDLFVNENANRSNTRIEIAPGSFTYSEPRKTFRAWYIQKRRHQGTAKFYKLKHKFQLFMLWFSSFLFYTLIIALICLRFDLQIVASLYGVVILLAIPIVWKCSRRLNEKDLFWMFPILDLIHPFLQPLFYISNLFIKQNAWK